MYLRHLSVTKDAFGATHIHVWREADHPRGQPANAGQFAKSGSASPAARVVNTARNVASKGANAARNFAMEDYETIVKHWPPPQERRKLRHHVAAAARTLPALLHSHIKEERHNAVHAVGALKSLATGNRPSQQQWHGLRAVSARVLMTSASVAVGDPTGTVGHLAVALGHEVVQHVVIEHALKLFGGAGMALVKRRGPSHDADNDAAALLQRWGIALAQAVEQVDQRALQQAVRRPSTRDRRTVCQCAVPMPARRSRWHCRQP